MIRLTICQLVNLSNMCEEKGIDEIKLSANYGRERIAILSNEEGTLEEWRVDYDEPHWTEHKDDSNETR